MNGINRGESLVRIIGPPARRQAAAHAEYDFWLGDAEIISLGRDLLARAELPLGEKPSWKRPFGLECFLCPPAGAGDFPSDRLPAELYVHRLLQFQRLPLRLGRIARIGLHLVSGPAPIRERLRHGFVHRHPRCFSCPWSKS